MDAPKRPLRQLLKSAVAPGIGSFSNGERRRGLAFYLLWELLILGLILGAGQNPQPLTVALFVTCLYGLPVVWITSMVSAWRGAGRHNLRRQRNG